MQDAAMYYSEISVTRSTVISDFNLRGKDFVLCTIHRAENTDDRNRLTSIINALNEIASEIELVLPLHPRTRKILDSLNLRLKTQKLRILEPVGYFDMIELLKNTKIVLTYSGGLQKEAYFFKKPCVTLRDETKWKELIEHGYNVLAGACREKIVYEFQRMRSLSLDFNKYLYGNGFASCAIVKLLH